MTTLERNLEVTFSSAEDLRWIHAYLRGILDAGTPPDVLEPLLQRVYEHFLEDGREDLADLVLDGLDFLTGWCGPELGLVEHDAA